jgi:HD superfamily phosphodiesterase
MTKDEVKKMIEEFHMPKHIRRHCEQVAKICEFLGRKLVAKGHKIDIELLVNAALLHDLFRICDVAVWNPQGFPDSYHEESYKKWEELRKKHCGKYHEDAVHDELIARGESRLAKLIKSHRFENILDEKPFRNWEEKILYYADKRVDHDKIVDLKERLEKGKKRNAVTEKQIAISIVAFPKIYELEKEICEECGVKPKDII